MNAWAISTTNRKEMAFHYSSRDKAQDEIDNIRAALVNYDTYEIQDDGDAEFVIGVTNSEGEFRGWIY